MDYTDILRAIKYGEKKIKRLYIGDVLIWDADN